MTFEPFDVELYNAVLGANLLPPEFAQKNKWKVKVTLEDKEIKTERTEEIVERKMKLLVGKQGELLRTPAARHTIALCQRTGEAFKNRPSVNPADDEDTPPFVVTGKIRIGDKWIQFWEWVD